MSKSLVELVEHQLAVWHLDSSFPNSEAHDFQDLPSFDDLVTWPTAALESLLRDLMENVYAGDWDAYRTSKEATL